MGLDDFAKNESDSDEGIDLSGLEEDESDADRVKRRANNGYCPDCDEKGKKTPRYDIKCTTDDCDVITFIPVNRGVSSARV